MPSSQGLDLFYEIQSMLQERGLNVRERRQDALDAIENFLSADGPTIRASSRRPLPTPGESPGNLTQGAQAERDAASSTPANTSDSLNLFENSSAISSPGPHVPPFITHEEWEAATLASDPTQQRALRRHRTLRVGQQQEQTERETANQDIPRNQIPRGLGISGGGIDLTTSSIQGHLGLTKWNVRCPTPININGARSAAISQVHRPSNGAILHAWKAIIADEKAPMFLRLPHRIHEQIFGFLNPIEECCLSIVNKYMHMLLPIRPKSQGGYSLLLGSPGECPILGPDSCRHCLPALYFPRHCELNFHLRSSMPKEMRFCAACVRYTHHCPKGLYDSIEYCGKCGVSYRQRFKRGRRRLVTKLKDESTGRVFKKPRWFNKSAEL